MIKDNTFDKKVYETLIIFRWFASNLFFINSSSYFVVFFIRVYENDTFPNIVP